MPLISLSHILENDINVYPGEEYGFQSASLSVEGFYVSHFSMGNHVGTHLDLPLHISPDTDSLETQDVHRFSGMAQKITINKIEADMCIPFHKIQLASNIDFLIFQTSWDAHWNTEIYFNHFPYFSKDWISFFLEANIKGIGVDTPSLDGLKTFPIHEKVLPKMIFYENLCNLSSLPEIFKFMGFPLRIKHAEASPVNCVAEF